MLFIALCVVLTTSNRQLYDIKQLADNPENNFNNRFPGTWRNAYHHVRWYRPYRRCDDRLLRMSRSCMYGTFWNPDDSCYHHWPCSCLIVGATNGTIIAYAGIHPFVVTLAMQSILRGAAYLIANGQPVPLYSNTTFPKIGTGLAFGVVPYPIIYMLIFFFLQYMLLNKTKLGRYIYAVGGNETAAQFSGINIKKVKIIVWTISGFLASFAGIVLSARLASGQPSTSIGAETDAIAGCVLGGTSMYGGVGNTGGVLIGIMVIGVISNGLTLMHVDSNWQYVVKGVIILLAVYVDMMRQKKMQSRSE